MSARITRRIRLGLALGAVLALVLLPAAYAERLRAGADAPTASVRNFPGPAPCNTTLPACVSGSNAGDVISITNGLLIEVLVVITHALTLQGHGPTLTVVAANSAHGVISIGVNIASGVVITGLGVLGGSNVPSGAGIFASSGSPLTLFNVNVVSNTSTSSGGGVFASDALTMSNVSLIGNQAPNGAGGGLRAASITSSPNHGSSSRPRTTITSAPAPLPLITAPTPG